MTHKLDATPPKPKAKVDQARASIIEKRKRGRLEKMLKRFDKMTRNMKPIEEIEGTPKLRKEIKLGMRTRKNPAFTEEQKEEAILLIKEWTRNRYEQHYQEQIMMNRIFAAQEKALQKLREESEELYQQAIQLDEGLITYSFTGPTETPPIKDFDPVDGEYSDITNYFDKPPKPYK